MTVLELVNKLFELGSTYPDWNEFGGLPVSIDSCADLERYITKEVSYVELWGEAGNELPLTVFIK